MNYLLLMYHPETYWIDQTAARDAEEEEAFAAFCQWMREEGITWESGALKEPVTSRRVRFASADATTRLLPELNEVISGYFLLNIDDASIIPELLRRVPRIESTSIELREIG